MEEMKYLSSITLATEVDKKVGSAEIKIGDARIGGITVWRGLNGKLRVFFPSQKVGYGWAETLSLPAEMRTEIEAEVIAAYRERKKELDAVVAEAKKAAKASRKRQAKPHQASYSPSLGEQE